LLFSMNSAVFQLEWTTPSSVQPRVPLVMPNVWLPVLPLVVTANICGPTPDWPSNSLEPTPHPPTLSEAAKAAAGSAATTSNAAICFLMRLPAKVASKVISPRFHSLLTMPGGTESLHFAREQGITPSTASTYNGTTVGKRTR